MAYAPLIDNLQAAIAEFTKSSSTGDEKVIGQNIEEALVIVRGFVEKLNALTGEEWRKLEAIGEQRQARLQLLAKLRNPHTVDENERYPLAKEFNSTAGKLARAWALASGSPNANEYRSDVRFYSDVRNQLIKMEAADRRANGEPLSEEIITLLSQLAVDSTASSQVIDVYGEIGRELPNLQDLNIEALNLRSRDESETALLIDALRRDLLQESRNATGNNEVRAKQFSERIRELMNRYTNQQLTSAEVIAELIELSKEIVAESNRSEQFSPPLSNDELAFYDVMATNGSAGELLEDDVLAQIARELVTALRRDAKTDWTVRDDVRAKLRRSIRTLLRKHKYSKNTLRARVIPLVSAVSRRYNQTETRFRRPVSKPCSITAPSASTSKLCRKVIQIPSVEQILRVDGLMLGLWAVFARPFDIGGMQTERPGCIQVTGMCSHHQHFVRFNLKQLGKA